MPIESSYDLDISQALAKLDQLRKEQEKIFGSPSKPHPLPPPNVDAHKAALDAISRETKRTADLKVQYESVSVKEITAQMNKLKNEYGSIQAAMLKETDARVKAEEKAVAQSVQQQIRDLQRLRTEKGGGLLDVVRSSGLAGGVVGGLIGGGIAGAIPMLTSEMKELVHQSEEIIKVQAQLEDAFKGDKLGAEVATNEIRRLSDQYKISEEDIKKLLTVYLEAGGKERYLNDALQDGIALMKRHQASAQEAGQALAKFGNPEVQARAAMWNLTLTRNGDAAQHFREMAVQLAPDLQILGQEAQDSAMGAEHLDVSLEKLKVSSLEALAAVSPLLDKMAGFITGAARGLPETTALLNAAVRGDVMGMLDIIKKGADQAREEAKKEADWQANQNNETADMKRDSLKGWLNDQKTLIAAEATDQKEAKLRLLQLDEDYNKKLRDINKEAHEDTRAQEQKIGADARAIKALENAQAKKDRQTYINEQLDDLRNDQANREAILIRADEHARKLEHDRQRDLLAERVQFAQETLDLETSLGVKKTGAANQALATAQAELAKFDETTREEQTRKWNELSLKLIKGQEEEGKKRIEEKKKEGAEIVKLQAEISGSEQEKAIATENVRFAEEEEAWKGHKDIIELIEKDHALKMAAIMNKESEDAKKVKEAFVSSFQGIMDRALSPLEKAMQKTNNIVGQEALNLLKKLSKIGEDKLIDLITGENKPTSTPVQSDTNVGDANFTAGQIKYVEDKYGRRYRPSSSDKVDISPNAGDEDTDEITAKAQETGIKFASEQLLEKGLHLAGFGEAAGAISPIGIIADAALAVHEHDKDAMQYQARHTLHGSESTAVSTPDPFMGGARLFGSNAFQSPAERMGLTKHLESLNNNTKATQDNSADTKLNSQSLSQSGRAVTTLAEKMGLNKKVAGKAGDVIDIFSSVGDLLGFAEGGVIGAPMVAFGKGGAVRLAENEPEAVLPLKEYNRYKQFTSSDTPNVSSNINIGINGTMKARGNTLQQVIESDTMVSQLTRA